MNNRGNFVVGLLFFIAIWVPVYFGTGWLYEKAVPECIEYRQIATIGGCNFLGMCGVQYSDGKTELVFLPAPGEESCVKRAPRKYPWFMYKLQDN